MEARIGSRNRNKRPTRLVCDVQTASISAARGIASREKSVVRPFDYEDDKELAAFTELDGVAHD